MKIPHTITRMTRNRQTTGAFILGVAAAPYALAGLYVTVEAADRIGKWVTELHDGGVYLRTERGRSLNAAAIMHAPRVAAVSLPGGVVLAWRSKVKWSNDMYKYAIGIEDLVVHEEEARHE